MAKKSKAIITLKDFVFFVVYEREGGYGRHEKRHLVKRANDDLNVEHIKGGRPHRTEWYPISRSDSAGFASVKYTIYPTWNGLKQLVSNADLYKYEHNTMGILDATWCFPAVSLDSGYNSGYGGYTSEEDLKKWFGRNYEREIHEYQDVSHVNCYVSVYVPEWRLLEAIETVFHKEYDNLSDNERAQIKPNINRYNELCELMNGYIERLVNDERDVEPDASQFNLDFRQLPIPFKD